MEPAQQQEKQHRATNKTGTQSIPFRSCRFKIGTVVRLCNRLRPAPRAAIFRTMMEFHPSAPLGEIRAALKDIVEGKTVKRSLHELRWGELDLSGEFIDILYASGFIPTTVRDIEVPPGRRVPAFVLRDGVAIFGWVFWEKFTAARQRKLFGSVARNDKGDWAVQIPPTRELTIFANRGLSVEMDQERPSSF